jgi:allophanate hydrolase subunit 2
MDKNEDSNLQEIFERVSRDPSLFSTIDVEKIFETIDKGKVNYLANKNLQHITSEIAETIIENRWSRELSSKLIGYRLVSELYELHKGKHVRWIRREPESKLTNGGIVVNIKFIEKGTYVVCKNNQNRILQYHFDNCVTFQKMTVEEQLVLLANEYTI